MADKKLIASAAFIASGAFLLWKSAKGEETTKETTAPQLEPLTAQAETNEETSEKPMTNYAILTITDANKETYIKSFTAGYSTMNFLVLDADYDLVVFETSDNASINLSGIKPSDSLGSFVNGQRIVLLGADPYCYNVRLSQEGANQAEPYAFSRYIYGYMSQPNASSGAYYEFMHYNGTWFSKTY